MTILIVDDEPDILELLEDEFSFNNFKTITATCGEDAVKKLNENVDLVWADYKMNNGDGMYILNEAKKMFKENCPVFFFGSGQADNKAIEITYEAGIRKFFFKPFDIEKIVKEISEMFKT